MRLPNGLKRCNACGLDFSPTLEHFYGGSNTSDGLQGKCKQCDNACRCHRAVSGDSIYHHIARELGVTVTRIKQIERSALRKLARSKLLRELAR